MALLFLKYLLWNIFHPLWKKDNSASRCEFPQMQLFQHFLQKVFNDNKDNSNEDNMGMVDMGMMDTDMVDTDMVDLDILDIDMVDKEMVDTDIVEMDMVDNGIWTWIISRTFGLVTGEVQKGTKAKI